MDFLQSLNHKTVLITGATGLIGRALIGQLLQLGENRPKVIALVRSLEKARRMFSEGCLEYAVGDVTQPIRVDGQVDYIIHAASQTSSKAFVTQPVETIQTALLGTANLLELARQKQVKSFVYLSSMEVYGSPDTDEKIPETRGTNLNTMSVRTSYPESKRMCEALCTAYWAEYGVPTKILRLTQTFGPGVAYDDGRVFAEFARCVLEQRNIVLHTKGQTRRSYLDTDDAARAILTVLLKGQNGEAYNAANEATYCSILEMAQLVAAECAGGRIGVEIQPEDEAKFGYAPVLKMNLDTQKLRALGWMPQIGLKESMERLLAWMQESKNRSS